MPNANLFACDRRELLNRLTVAAGTMTLIGSVVNQIAADTASEKVKLEQGDVVLFQGDSITDVQRNRKREKIANDGRCLGHGYPLMIGGQMLLKNPTLDLQIYNRGISGNRVPDLQRRWQQDCIALKPKLLSILIGVNDIWHKLGGRYDGTVETYANGYKQLLTETQTKLPDTQIVVCEPFALKVGSVNDKWFPEFDQRRQSARRACDSVGAIWVPFQSMFDKAIESGMAAQTLAGDGVHPSIAGHMLMAETWQKVLGL